MEKLIYRRSILSRLFHFFGYYWGFLTALLFLPLCIFGGFVCISRIIELFLDENKPGETMGNSWLYLGIAVLFSAWAIYCIVRFAKTMFKPKTIYRGIIKEKKDGDYDEGYYYQIKISSCEKEYFDVNEKTYAKLKEGQKVQIVFSNKLDEVMRITLI